MTTRQSASLAVHGEVKRGHINAAPKAPLWRRSFGPKAGVLHETVRLPRVRSMRHADIIAAACLARQQIQFQLNEARWKFQPRVIDDDAIRACQPAYLGNTVSGVELQGIG